ncbi:MAG TPA: STAS domain-containing protein [Streptosporangiaceae bacterium]|nr:STAS domain-containing protein [Streptosporangiaceae bacterium]
MTAQRANGTEAPGVTSTVARLGGDLDAAAAPALRENLRGLLMPGMRLLIIDLSDVPSCDIAGLAVLIGTQRSAAARGITVCLATPSRQVAELLRSTGLDRSLPVSPDRERQIELALSG